MAKLSKATTAMKPPVKKVAPKTTKKEGGKSVLQSKKTKTKVVHGTDGMALKAKTELFLTAISTFAGEDTFYEKGQDRIDRVRELTHAVTDKDPEWMQKFIPWLRGPEVNIRTISLIIAAEYVAYEGPNARRVIDSVCQRADEPAEILAYWMKTNYGWDGMTYPMPAPKLPAGLRKGLVDACIRLYNQYTLLKYDGASRGVGMASVLNLIHPRVKDYPSHWDADRIEQQRATFQFIIDKEFGNEQDKKTLKRLPQVKENIRLRALSRDSVLTLSTADLKDAGVTWEQMGTLLQGPWTASAWEAMIPNMGYMALLRNLRNFEGANISKTYQQKVIDVLVDPERVATSRQLPFRFLSAYKNLNSDTYSRALGEALDLSCQNIPSFDGRTLILVDKSGSMDDPIGGTRDKEYSEGIYVKCWEVGALFAMALHLKQGQGNSDLAIFATSSKRIPIPAGSSVLKGMKLLEPNNGVAHGTNIWGSVKTQYASHDRVVIFTDCQSNIAHATAKTLGAVPFIHCYDLGGYGVGLPFQTGDNGRYQYGGFSDASFKLMSLLETQSAGWPFL